LINQGRVQGWVGGILTSSGSDQTRSQNAPLWGISWYWSTRVGSRGRWVTFLPPLGLTKPGHRMPPCEEISWYWQIRERFRMDGWVGDILTSSGSDQTRSQNAPLWGISWFRSIKRIWSRVLGRETNSSDLPDIGKTQRLKNIKFSYPSYFLTGIIM
jgi:hypothetical protein